jgi:hypothetical protein
MQVQTEDPAVTAAARAGTTGAVAAAARLLHVTPAVLAGWVNAKPANAGKSKKAGSNANGASGSGRASASKRRSDNKSGSSSDGKRAKKAAPADSPRPPGAHQQAALRQMHADGVSMGALRVHEGLPALTFDEAFAKAMQGHCLLCQNGKHMVKKCPMWASAHAASKPAAGKFMKALQEATAVARDAMDAKRDAMDTT